MYKKIIALLVLLLFTACFSDNDNNPGPDPVTPNEGFQTFSDFFEELQVTELEDRALLVNDYFDDLASKEDFPLINEDEVTFIYKSDDTEVYINGDLDNWGSLPLVKMIKLEGTDIFYYKESFPTNARLEYEFYNQDGDYILDPLNPNAGLTGWGKHSEYTMPDYPLQEETLYYDDIPHGELTTDHEISCTAIVDGESVTRDRPYQIYLPPNYNENTQYKVIYFQDGSDYSNLMQINNVLDYMIANDEIDPVIGVFINCIDRNSDYIYENKDVYLDFIVNTMIPFIDSTYSTDTSSDGRVITGVSNSGSFSVYAAYKHPELFAHVLSQSGALNTLSSYGETLGSNFSSADLPFRLYQIVGRYESWYNINKSSNAALLRNQSLEAYKYIECNQGHTIFAWRDTFREGLAWLLSDDPGDDMIDPSTNTGDEIFSYSDIEGDGNRAGDLMYPTNAAFSENAFDLKTISIYEDEDNYIFNLSITQNFTNPWGVVNGWSLQNFDIYLNIGTGEHKQTMLGKNLEINQGWDKAIFVTPENDHLDDVYTYLESNSSVGDSDSENENINDDIILATNFSCFNDTVTVSISKSELENLDITGVQVLLTSHDAMAETLIREISSLAGNWNFGGGLDSDNEVNVLDVLGDNSNLANFTTEGDSYYFPSIDLITIN